MKQRTVFVVGAGASAEFGLPIGGELQSRIADMMNMKFDAWQQVSGDSDIYQEARRRFGKEDRGIGKAARLISDGVRLTDSIDNFMEKHRNDEKIQVLGKLAIAKCIAEAERDSRLFIGPYGSRDALDVSGVSDTWIVPLFRHLQRSVGAEDLDKVLADVSFIVFNYDRCIEHFLRWAIMLSHGCNEDDAARVVSEANIYHPYGSLGPLPRTAGATGTVLEFGSSSFDLFEVSNRITTYGEQVLNDDELTNARTWIRNAQQIVFLGFGFHPQNMALMEAPRLMPPKTRTVIGTAYGESAFNQEQVAIQLRDMFNPHNVGWRPHLFDGKCSATVREYARAFE